MDSTDTPAGATTLVLVDLPALDGAIADSPLIYLAAAGAGAGWRRAEIDLSFDDGASWQTAGRTAAPAVIGRAIGTLAPGPAELFDRRTSVEVMLLNDGLALSSASEAQIVDGANLALIGDEIVQFGTAEQIGSARWRLRDLLRGRRGSDWAIAAHVPGERFLLLDSATLLRLDVPLARVGATVRAGGRGPGDGASPATAAIAIEGRALRPLSPTDLRAHRRDDGAIEVAWVRRSRNGWAWADGVDVPLGEDRERYRIVVQGAGGLERRVEVDTSAWVYLPADQIADGWSGSGLLSVDIVQIGTYAASLPAHAGWLF